MKQTELKRNSELRRTGGPKRTGRRRRKAKPGWKMAVFAQYGFRCVVTNRRAQQAHHAIPQQVLSDRGREDLLDDETLGVPVTAAAHAAHEAASRRIRHAELPEPVINRARAEGFGWYIDDPRYYP